MSDDFASNIQKLTDLAKEVDLLDQDITRKEKCIPIIVIGAIVVPVLAWLLLYFLQPSFVQSKEGLKYVRNNSKVFWWTVIITAIIWGGMYLFTYCKGYKGGKWCSRKIN